MEHSPGPPRDEPNPGGGLLLRALLLKLLFGALLVAIAARWPADSPYLAPREGDANDVVYTLARGFDANAYQRLALHGYYDEFSRNYPLGYPLLVRGAFALVGNAQTAAVLATNASALLAVLLFALVARRYVARSLRRGAPLPPWRSTPAVWLFMATPGWLVFGTVAYSEATYLALALAAWWAYLRADEGAASVRRASQAMLAAEHAVAVPPSPGAAHVAGRSLPWLVFASLLVFGSVMVRHAGGALLLALGLIEGWRVLRAPAGRRGRAVTEAVAACWSALPLALYFAWKYAEHDLGGLQERIWRMGFVPLGGLASLVSGGAAPEYVAQIYATLPLLLWLLWRARRIDPRLTVVGCVSLFVLLSYTGTAAQSLMRYMWTLWPASLGALAVRDRGLVFALAALLFCLSVMIGAAHVLGTAAL